jgi:hypothetical protein
MKKQFTLWCIVLLCVNFVIGQSGSIQWQRTFGGTKSDNSSKAMPTDDHGFLIVGVTNSSDGDVVFLNGDADIWILKLDSLGNIQWTKTIGGSEFDATLSFDFTIDGGFVIGGTTRSNDSDVSGHHGETDFWIVKLDNQANIQWQKCYGGSDFDDAFDIKQTPDSGFIVAGPSSSNDGDVIGQHSCHGCDPDFWILKLDQTGNLEWQRCLGSIFKETPASVAVTSDGGFVVAGYNSSSNSGDVSGCHGLFDYWVVKLDSTGTLLWQRCLGGTNNDAGKAVVCSNDGGVLVFGESNSNDGDVSGNHGSWDAWLVKLDSAGNISWQKSYGGSGSESGKALAQYNDSSIFLVSFAQSNDGDVSGNHGMGDFWVTKTDYQGNILWQNCYGGSDIDMPYSIFVLNEEEVILSGYSRSYDGDVGANHGGNCNGFVCEDMWVLKLFNPSVSITENSLVEDVKMFPNPFVDKLSLHSLSELNGYVTILNIIGEVVHQFHGTYTNSLDLSFLTEGVYFLEYSDRNTSFVKKIIKIK